MLTQEGRGARREGTLSCTPEPRGGVAECLKPGQRDVQPLSTQVFLIFANCPLCPPFMWVMFSWDETSATFFLSAGQAVILTVPAHSHPVLCLPSPVSVLPAKGPRFQPGLSQLARALATSHIHGVGDTETCRYGEASAKMWDCWRKFPLVTPSA